MKDFKYLSIEEKQGYELKKKDELIKHLIYLNDSIKEEKDKLKKIKAESKEIVKEKQEHIDFILDYLKAKQNESR